MDPLVHDALAIIFQDFLEVHSKIAIYHLEDGESIFAGSTRTWENAILDLPVSGD